MQVLNCRWILWAVSLVAVIGIVAGGLVGTRTAIATPSLILDEDFTDGALDAEGNWQVFGGGRPGFVGFKPPNAERLFPVALVRTPALGGDRWSGVGWSSQENNGLQEFLVHKQDEVVVLKFTAFSDLSGPSRLGYGVEVALLEERAAMAGPPHYGHDLSFEAEQVFNTKRDADQVQLFANVENQETVTEGTRHAHSPDLFSNPALLDRAYQNLVIWRNLPGSGQTNIEQWGEHRSDDYRVPSEMNSQLHPNALESVFNRIQITLFSTGLRSRDVIRSGVQADEAQIGITHVHVGVTLRSDFNIDYGVNIDDFFALARGWGQGNKTLLNGDADNNSTVDVRDFEILKQQFKTGTAQAIERYRREAFLDQRQSDDRLQAIVDARTGMIKLVTKSGEPLHLYGYKLTSAGGAFIAGNAQNCWRDGLETSLASEISDGDWRPSVAREWEIGSVYNRDKKLRDIEFVWQGSLGDKLRLGHVVYTP